METWEHHEQVPRTNIPRTLLLALRNRSADGPSRRRRSSTACRVSFRDLPTETVAVDLHCVTRWSKLGTSWEGVSLDTMLADLKTFMRR